MKRLHVLLLVALSSALMISGCGKKEEPEDPVVTQVIEKQPEGEEAPAEDTAEAPTDTEKPPKEGMVRSPLTNEWIEGDLGDKRPIAVMVPNDAASLPHYNISKADILYECPVEGNITRTMAVIKDWENLERIGSVRSCRDYFVYWSFEWDAIYLHIGGPFYINDLIERKDTDHITGSSYGDKRTDNLYDGTFFRTTDKKAPHNAYASADGINKGIAKFDYSKTYRDEYYKPDHFKFSAGSAPNELTQYSDSFSANDINLKSAYPITKTAFEYKAEDGLYYRSMYGKPDIDAANGDQQLAFKNVLVQYTYHEVRDQKGYLAFQVHDTTRDGYYFTNGKGIHVTWKKASDYEATKYYDDDGKEIEINTGKTMICIVQEGDSFTVDDTTYKSEKK